MHAKMGDMTQKEKEELYARLDELKPLPEQIRTVVSTITKIEVAIMNMMGNPEAPHSRGMIQTLQEDVKYLKEKEFNRLHEIVQDQDARIKTFEELRDKARGYLIGTAIGSGTTGGAIGIALTKLFGG